MVMDLTNRDETQLTALYKRFPYRLIRENWKESVNRKNIEESDDRNHDR